MKVVDYKFFYCYVLKYLKLEKEILFKSVYGFFFDMLIFGFEKRLDIVYNFYFFLILFGLVLVEFSLIFSNYELYMK